MQRPRVCVDSHTHREGKLTFIFLSVQEAAKTLLSSCKLQLSLPSSSLIPEFEIRVPFWATFSASSSSSPHPECLQLHSLLLVCLNNARCSARLLGVYRPGVHKTTHSFTATAAGTSSSSSPSPHRECERAWQRLPRGLGLLGGRVPGKMDGESHSGEEMN